MEKQGKCILSNETILSRNWVLWEKCGKSTCRVYALLHHRDNSRCEAVQRLCLEASNRRGRYEACHLEPELRQLYETSADYHCEASRWREEQAPIAADRDSSLHIGPTQSTSSWVGSAAPKHASDQCWISHLGGAKHSSVERGDQGQNRIRTHQNAEDGQDAEESTAN